MVSCIHLLLPRDRSTKLDHSHLAVSDFCLLPQTKSNYPPGYPLRIPKRISEGNSSEASANGPSEHRIASQHDTDS
jgi:hypothetical protein